MNFIAPRTLAIALCLILLNIGSIAFAQKTAYKNGTITVGGKDIARVVKIKDKENFGLTSTYELWSLNDKKLIIATIAPEFKPANGDNANLYYRLSFLPTGQVAIFTLASLGAEKSFAKLIGESAIVTGDSLDIAKVDELIARKGRNPRAEVEYHLVNRNMMGPVIIEKDNRIAQGATLIGYFKDISSRGDFDTYEFSLPDGLVVARVTFTGGNNAKTAQFYTVKDRISRNVNIESPLKTLVTVMAPGEDRNNIVLKRIADWLVKNRYL